MEEDDDVGSNEGDNKEDDVVEKAKILIIWLRKRVRVVLKEMMTINASKEELEKE